MSKHANTQIHHANETEGQSCVGFVQQACYTLIQPSNLSCKVRTQTHRHTVTCELSGKACLSLERVDIRMDDHTVVVTEPVGFTHPLLQSLTHVLLSHMKDTQVRETEKEKENTNRYYTVLISEMLIRQ